MAPPTCFSPVTKVLLCNFKENRENRENLCASCLSRVCDKSNFKKDGFVLTRGLKSHIADSSTESSPLP
jgi:hypothetical protein